jgi:hypothetical protein
VRSLNVPDISEAQYCQGDLTIAIQFISQHNLPLDKAGAIEAERLIREYGEGNRPLWVHPEYLRYCIFTGQALIGQVRVDDAKRAAAADATTKELIESGKLDWPPGSGKYHHLCGRCGTSFEMKRMQRHHAKVGHQVYCGSRCVELAYPHKIKRTP